MDMCFELATQIMARLGGAVAMADEVHGFKYFDDRDLLGFVDGTENPVDQAAVDATVIGEEDAAFAGGSYVIVQKYLHDLKGWNAVPVEQQEGFVGRTKLSDIELDYDRLLDFSRPVTGTLFFAPSATFLDEAVAAAAPAATDSESAADSPPPPAPPDGSLGIGSLKSDAGKD